MRTAIQELIEWTNQYEGKMISADQVILKAYKMLEKEKKQITDACWYGHDIKHEYFNPIHYFDQTYNQNK